MSCRIVDLENIKLPYAEAPLSPLGDLNTLLPTGIYPCNYATIHGPEGVSMNGAVVLNLFVSEICRYQTLYTWTASNQKMGLTIFIREMTGSGQNWGVWKKFQIS